MWDGLRYVSAWNIFSLANLANILGGAWFIERCHAASACIRLSSGLIGPLFYAVISAFVVELFLLCLRWSVVNVFGLRAFWGVGVCVNMYCSGICIGEWDVWSVWVVFWFGNGVFGVGAGANFGVRGVYSGSVYIGFH